MKIENAYLCEDCQEVSETDGHGGCEVCGSRALLNLGKILNRNSDEEILNFAPLVSARIADEEVVLCLASGGHGKHAA
jgi:DNA-directed RNA polymerase subunit RPC12/RpoP